MTDLTDQQIGEIERGWNKPYDCNVCLGLSPSWDGHDRTCRGRVWESVPLLVRGLRDANARAQKAEAELARHDADDELNPETLRSLLAIAEEERDALAARLASAEAKLRQQIADKIEACPTGASGATHVAVAFFRRSAAAIARGALAADATPEPTEPINPAHPTFCMRDCGCIKPRGHDGDCDRTGPLPKAGCRCLKCSAIPEQEAGKNDE